MSDTLRTDTAIIPYHDGWKLREDVVPANLARELERELTIMTAQRDSYQQSNVQNSNKVIARGYTIEKLCAELTAVTAERDALKVEYESRAEWISKMNSILGYDNSDGFYSEPSPEKLAAEAIADKHRLDKLGEYCQAIACILFYNGWTAPNDARWFRLKEILSRFREVIDNATNSNKP